MTATEQHEHKRPTSLFSIKVIHKGETMRVFDYFTDSLTAMEQTMVRYPQASLISVHPAMPVQGDGVGVELC